jgi:hypothetical protein
MRNVLWPTGLVLLLAGCPEPTKMPEPTEVDLAAPGAEMGPVPDLRESDLPPEYPTAVPICTPPPNRWCWENPLPQGNELLAVWSFSPRDVWAAGRTGTILHYDGMGWTAVPSGTEEGLWALWGSAPADLWAVGSGGTILHWDGAKWSRVPGGGTTWLQTVWGTGPKDVWAGGMSFDLLHWDGTKWSAVPSGQTDAGVVRLWGHAPDDYWASPGFPGRVLHWDGTKWTRATGFIGNIVRSLWGSGANDVWFMTLGVIHWDGRGFWNRTPMGFSLPTKSAAWGNGPKDIWVAGETEVARYDGWEWRRAKAPLLDVANGEEIFGISGTGPNDMWTVSYRMHHWDGMGWYSPGGGTRALLTAGWATGPDEAWVVGWAPGNKGIILRRSGGRWSTVFNGLDLLNGIWASGPNDVWAVGVKGLILHWDGAKWMQVPSGTMSDLLAVHGTAPGNVFAVGLNGIILRWNGTVWSSMISGTTKWLYGVWSAGTNDSWAAGDDGLLLHWDGASWKSVVSGTTNSLGGFWGSDARDLWVVGVPPRIEKG